MDLSKAFDCLSHDLIVDKLAAYGLDNGGQVDTFILDFEKAFDTPPHELLKRKLFG